MMQRLLTVVLALGLGAASACGAAGPAGSTPPAGHTAPPSATAAMSSSPSATAPAARCDTGAWRAAPVTATRHPAVPPVPVVGAVRTASHPECGYDRIVLDITGPFPGLVIRYVSHVAADPSGTPISMAGRRFLLVTVRPAQAHGVTGATTISRQVHVLGYPMLAGWALAGDFEGVVTLALGLHGAASVRVGDLPGRLYIDVRQ